MQIDRPSSLPLWLSSDDAQSQIPAHIWPLISYPDSLTERLRQITQQQLGFRLLFANWGSATPDERQSLNLSTEEPTWIRCIEHRHNDQLWVYGRTVFPKTTIHATEHTLSGLGVQSLGDVIFKDPDLRRDPFEYCLLDNQSPHALLPNGWARRSTVYFQQQPMLITEVFLPDCDAS